MVSSHIEVARGLADTDELVRPSVGYEAEDFFFGFNYLEWVDGWPVLVGDHLSSIESSNARVRELESYARE